MRKVMLLAAIMAMVLAAAAPAFAQASAVGGNIEYADCDQILAAANVQYANETGDAAAIAAEQGVSQEAVQACLDSAATGDISVNVNTASAGGHTGSASASAGGGGGGGGGGGSASAAAGGSLPDTGGASLFALGAGALLVAGGLLARRIVR